MSKDRITGRNKELLQETARRLGISKDEVYSKISEGILFMAQFNPKILGGHLKRMELDMPQEEVLKKQIADDTFLASLNKTQENSPQQQEATSSTASCQENTLGWSDANKKRLKFITEELEKSKDEVLNEIPQDILGNPESLGEYLTVLIDSVLLTGEESSSY